MSRQPHGELNGPAGSCVGLKVNDLVDPAGLDSPRPRFSWRFDGSILPQRFQIQVTQRGSAAPLWEHEFATGPTHTGTKYDGPALESMTVYNWRVRAIHIDSDAAEWSLPAAFETGMLSSTDWTAKWITNDVHSAEGSLYLRGTINLPAEVRSARAYASALGWYRLYINDIDITGHALVPRWTPFDQYVEYQTYDITEALRPGTNTISMVIAEGRFRGKVGHDSGGGIYGKRLAGIAQLEISHTNGETSRFETDSSWLAGNGRILRSDPKGGESVDLRIPDDDWRGAGDGPSRFRPVEILPPHRRELVAEEVARVRAIGTIAALSVTRAPSGEQIVDFGQNFAGVARIRVSGNAGDLVRLSYSELLTAAGELNRSYLVGPLSLEEWFQQDRIILNGKEEWWESCFTVHGFRYVAVSGLEVDLSPNDIEGIVISTDLQQTATFSCSDPRLNRLFENAQWGLKSNFMDTPTDCPTRERSGWTADTQVFAPTAAILVDADAYLRRYLRNLAAEQEPDGRSHPIIPTEQSENVGISWFSQFSSGSVGWGDAAVLLPWAIYLHSGNPAILETQFESARRWVDYLERQAASRRHITRRFRKGIGHLERYILDTGFHFGEWLRPGEKAQPIVTRNMIVPPAAIATAYLAHSSEILAQMAKVIGRADEAERYARLATNTRRAWRMAFIKKDGRIGRDKQDDYVRALAFDLVLPEQRPAAIRRLVQRIEEAGGHLGTGFLSTGELLPTLANGGRKDVALRLLLQDTAPSWLYQVDQGATTMWETWSGGAEVAKFDGSRNHYAFGSVARWLVEGLAGLTRTAPGYRRIRIDPAIGAGITSAATEILTPLGRAASSWRLTDGHVELSISIPSGAIAEVHLGEASCQEVGAGDHHFSWPHPQESTPPSRHAVGDPVQGGTHVSINNH